MTNDKPICLLFGGNKLNAGIVRKFKQWGCSTVVVDWNESPALTGDLHIRLDVKTPLPILEELKRQSLLGNVVMGFTSIDVAVPSMAQVLGQCGLKVNSKEGLANAFSKSRQTCVWNEAGLLNRMTETFEDWDDSICGWKGLKKIIVKPDAAASSRGITIFDEFQDKESLKAAFLKAKGDSTNGKVVVEEFVTGTEYTIEMLGDGIGNVAVYAVSEKQHTKNAIRNKIAVKLHYNAVPDGLQSELAAFGIACYRALGFKNSFGHLEVIRKSDGTISPIEIGARSSGFIASDLVDVVSGRSYLKDLHGVYNGGTVVNGLLPQTDFCSMYFFYDLPAGATIKRRCTFMDFCDKSIVSLASDTDGIYQGRRIGNLGNDNERIGFEILKGKKGIMTREYVLDVEKKMISEMFG